MTKAAGHLIPGTRGGPDPVEQWQKFSEQPITVYRVPGTHTTMMLQGTNAEVLANKLKASLDAPLSPAFRPERAAEKVQTNTRYSTEYSVLCVAEALTFSSVSERWETESWRSMR